MAQIEFNKEDISFRVTDTLHQLVDRLNTFEDRMVENRKLLDSNINDLLFMVHRDSGFVTADSDLLITSENLTLETSGDFVSTSSNQTLSSSGLTSVVSTGSIVLSSENDAANVILRSSGAVFGSLRNVNGNLEVLSGLSPAVSFTNTGATFPGLITMPSSGDGSPYTIDKTVSGAINELHAELEQITSEELARITALGTSMGEAQGDIRVVENRSTNNVARIESLEAINIASRLNTIEAQIVQINNRLNVLEL